MLQVYKQKVKHLLYEHQEDNATLRIEAEQQQKQTLDEAERRVQELVTDKQNLQRELNEQACWLLPNLLSTQGDDEFDKRLLLSCKIYHVSISPQSFASLYGHAIGSSFAMVQEVAKGEMLHSLQVQHAKQITKLRQEMQATVQQMAEGHQHDMHEFREQQVLTYRQRVQVVEDRKAAHMQVCMLHSLLACSPCSM